MEFFTNTRAVGSQLLKDVERILFWTTIVVQIIFFGFYGYSIYGNLDHLPLLITYIALTLLSLVNFIFYLVTHKKKKTSTIKNTKFFFRIFKYVINGSMLIIKTIDLIYYGGSDLDIILIAISGISLALQIILEIIRAFVKNYVDKFTVAFKQDIQPVMKVINAPKQLKEAGIKFKGKVGEKVLDLVTSPISYFANKSNESKQTKKEQQIYDITDNFRKNQNEKKEPKTEELSEESSILYSKINEEDITKTQNIKANLYGIASAVTSIFKKNQKNNSLNNSKLINVISDDSAETNEDIINDIKDSAS